jgi:hypothetical protein
MNSHISAWSSESLSFGSPVTSTNSRSGKTSFASLNQFSPASNAQSDSH